VIGRTLLSTYGSVATTILSLFGPEHNWDIGKFSSTSLPLSIFRRHVAHKFLSPAQPQPNPQALKLIESFIKGSLSSMCNVKTLEDWVTVKQEALAPPADTRIAALGGLAHVLAIVYPQHPWPVWKMSNSRMTSNWWHNLAVRFQSESDQEALKLVGLYLKDLEKELNIVSHKDWYDVSIASKRAVWYRITQLGGLRTVLARVYPNHNWKWEETKPVASSQSKHIGKDHKPSLGTW